jgi:hypothetical protein
VMNTQFGIPCCDCCGLTINFAAGDACPRCGYPVTAKKEVRFLVENIRNLQRVATYGGGFLTVTDLISRYQRRLYLLQPRTQAMVTPVAPSIPVQQTGSTGSTISASEVYGNGDTKPIAAVENPSASFPAVPARLPVQLPMSQGSTESQTPVQPAPSVREMSPVVVQKATRTFSLKAFLPIRRLISYRCLARF